MADYWEQTEFSVTDTRPILPYVITPPSGPPAMPADPDTTPKGRNISGDYLCNFEEYRGAITSPDTHIRFDPLMKTVFVHLRTNLDSVVREAMPGYIDNLNEGNFETEIYFTDHLKWGPDTSWMEDDQIERLRPSILGRNVNFNKTGAGRWYPGYGLPTTNPATDSIAGVVTFWRWEESSDQRTIGRPITIYGRTVCDYVWENASDSTDGGSVPSYTVRIVIVLDKFEEIQNNDFYRNDSTQWNIDFPLTLRKTISHEFGHSVGMLHAPSFPDVPPESMTIMSKIGVFATGQFLTSDSTWASTSRGQFSIRRPHP